MARSYVHMANPAFATETSLIDPPPHRRIAVYERMLEQSPLPFLPADDAGAGKTIMTGLYAREKQDLLRLRFRIASGADARARNPFAGPESDPIIVSIDALAGERMFGRLREDATEPCDLTVFDEAHKLSSDRGPDFRVRKTGRYRPAQTIPAARFPGRPGICCCSPQPAILILAWSDAADRSRRSQEGMSTAIMRTAAPRRRIWARTVPGIICGGCCCPMSCRPGMLSTVFPTARLRHHGLRPESRPRRRTGALRLISKRTLKRRKTNPSLQQHGNSAEQTQLQNSRRTRTPRKRKTPRNSAGSRYTLHRNPKIGRV